MLLTRTKLSNLKMQSDVHQNNKLITGIPRSGTTLCCNLLNQCENAVALHEPIDPQKLTSIEPATAVEEISKQIKDIRTSLENSQAIEHGDNAGIQLDNPIGLDTNDKGLRRQQANRGKVVLPPIDDKTTLFVKQNALFTALAGELLKQYSLTAIVRNPIDVLLSWMTVDLPVNKGRFPAGEMYDRRLAEELSKGTVIERQIAIYRWFIEKFSQAKLTTVRYEDIIETNGQALYSVLGIMNTTSLSPVERKFSQNTVSHIKKSWSHILFLGLEAGYSEEFLYQRFAQHVSSV